MKLYTLKNLINPLLVIIFIAVFNQSNAQSLQRQSMGSIGVNTITDGTLIQQTVGQAYSTKTSYSNGITFRPGFEQPVFKISLIQSEINLNVFPNPATEKVTIQSTEMLKDVVIQVMDISGKLLIHEQISEFSTYSFVCETWANGVYMISVSDSKNSKYSSKLVILK